MRASAELALAPPTISAQLRALEERLGERLLTRRGRRLHPTDVGRMVYEYADEIFRTGRDLMETLERHPSERPLRLVVGIDDVLPKQIGYAILEPALGIGRPVRLLCREGSLEQLVAQLAVHEIDVVISDAPVTASLAVHAFNHRLGDCNVVWMSEPTLGRKLRRGFPASLDNAPVLLPTNDTAMRRSLDTWLDKQNTRPLMVGEFEDYAMLREFARAGHGVAPVPTVLEERFQRELGLVSIGPAQGVKAEFYAISIERRIRHPAVAAITDVARQLFGEEA